MMMKIMWIVNIVFPYPAEQLGLQKTVTLGWLYGLFESLKKEKEIQLAIAATYPGKELLTYSNEGVLYYLLPCKNQIKYDAKLEKYWKQVAQEFQPDVVHIHGTEYAHGLSFVNACPEIKTVTSIQGLVSVYERVYTANIGPKEILKNITLKDILKRDSIYQQQRKYYKRGLNEIKLLQKTNYAIGRTDWDHANYLEIAARDHYFICNESLREEFYEQKWDITKINRNTIFVSQAYYTIKGFHFILKSMHILKQKYPDIMCYVAGYPIWNAKSKLGNLKISGYGKYIKKLIKKYNLENNICFLGLLDTEEMLANMLKCHVFVQASAIENSPNSLGEAMLIGMPCVSSNVGGVMDLLIHKQEGFVYPYTEYAMLAYYIDQFFKDDALCTKMGNRAQIHASITHDRDNNLEMTKLIYRMIMKEVVPDEGFREKTFSNFL